MGNGLHHDVIFYSFSGPDDMEVVILRNHGQFTLFPPSLFPHPFPKPEIVELCQFVENRLSAQYLLRPK